MGAGAQSMRWQKGKKPPERHGWYELSCGGMEGAVSEGEVRLVRQEGSDPTVGAKPSSHGGVS